MKTALNILLGIGFMFSLAVIALEGYIICQPHQHAACALSCNCANQECTCKVFRTNGDMCQCSDCTCAPEQVLTPLTDEEFKQLQDALRKRKQCCKK